MKKRVWAVRTVFVLTAFYLLNTAALRAAAVEERKSERVRVGFFAMEGYHMLDDDGRRSGYGYDYLQYMARYTNFEYEYIGYDKSWSEIQDMLEAGQIDLLTSAQKTGEREQRFDFSDKPIGSSAAILTVKEGDDRYMVDDYTRLDGIRIGMLAGNSRNKDLEQFASENGFTYRPVYYSDMEEMAQALQKSEEIDAVLTSNLRKTDREWIVATFAESPFYIMVRKGDQELLDLINGAVDRLSKDQKELADMLYERHYAADSGDKIAYTAQERRYIEKWRESGKTVRVTVNSGREPVSYFADGQARGILPEIAREVLSRTGLPYELIATPPTVDARELLVKEEAEARFDGTADFNDAEDWGLRVTDPYIELPISSVTLKSFSGKPETVAVIKNSDVVEEYVKQNYDEPAIFRYDSAAECLDAVLNGSQDAAFFQTYIAQRMVSEDSRNRIREQLVPGYGMSFAVSVKCDDPLLFSILDKAVLSLGKEEINRIVLEQTSYLSQNMSLVGYLYAHPVFFIILLCAAAFFIILLILYIFRQKNLRLAKEKARELERFISYVCKANSNVLEIDLERRLCLSYHVEAGKVINQKKELEGEARPIEFVHPEEREAVLRLIREEEIQRLIAGGEEAYFECRAKAQPGGEQYRWFSCTLQGVPKDENGGGSLMIFIKDIDRAKREEEEKRQALQDALATAQQANEARGSFMSRMSHEIRTPLNAIIGYMTIAEHELDNPDKIGEYLNKSEFAAHQLLNIVNDVLDISAIESGKMRIAHEEFNIKQLLSGITSIFYTQASEKGVTFRIRMNGLTEEKLVGDQFRLNQILMNLLSNAVKFTPRGGQVTLVIVQKTVLNRRVYLQFEVRDTGIGMSEEYRTRAFLPFEQQDASTARKFGGTGLGLSITKNLVVMMNGTIGVKSEEGRGTCFTVNLSFEMPMIRDSGAQAGDFSHLHALVLYGHNSDYEYIQTLLERLGTPCDLVFGVDEAVRKITEKKDRGEKYQLCLIDWNIPEIEGMEAARRIREAAASEEPLLLAAAYEDPMLPADDPLIRDVILKPVFQSSLFDVLSNLCGRSGERERRKQACGNWGLEGTRILLAEDNELNMEIAVELLTQNGMIVDGAKNGGEALERFENSQEGTYQAILMDIQMPVLNGYEAARRIRGSAHPQAGSIPIIALSADAFAEDINRALSSGMNAHVSKPIDFERLCAVLSEQLRK